MDFAARFVPSEAMGLVRRILQSVLTPNRGGLLSIGLAGTIWAASGGFSAMIDALDIAYDARASRPMLKQRLVAVALTFMTGGLMAIAMLLTMVGDRAGHFLSNVLHLSYVFERSWPFLRWGIIGLCIVLSMELLYFLGPNVKQRFKHTLPGALIGTVLWILISAGVNVYVSPRSQPTRTVKRGRATFIRHRPCVSIATSSLATRTGFRTGTRGPASVRERRPARAR